MIKKLKPRTTFKSCFHSVVTNLAVFMPDQQGSAQAAWRTLCSLTPPLQVQHLVLQQHHSQLVVAPDDFCHLWSLRQTQTGGVTEDAVITEIM